MTSEFFSGRAVAAVAHASAETRFTRLTVERESGMTTLKRGGAQWTERSSTIGHRFVWLASSSHCLLRQGQSYLLTSHLRLSSSLKQGLCIRGFADDDTCRRRM